VSKMKLGMLVVFALVLGLALGNVVSAMAVGPMGGTTEEREAFITERQKQREALQEMTIEEREAYIAERQAEREAFRAERQKRIESGELAPGEGMGCFGPGADGIRLNPDECPAGGVCDGTGTGRGVGMGGRGMGKGRGMGMGLGAGAASPSANL